jgi:tryptophan 2,3-dioxygenase
MAVIMTYQVPARYARPVSPNAANAELPHENSAAAAAVTGEWGGTDVAFGEQGARLTYGSYLRLPELLGAQLLESDPPAHDELLFITIHQVYELWFKQLLHEASAARDAMLAVPTAGDDRPGQLWWAQHLLRRMHSIERVLVQQIDVLETMTPQDFLQFRQNLAPASGFQSVQFRELEFLSGAKDATFVRRFRGLTDDERARLEARLAEPTLWDAFLHVLAARGLSVGDDDAVTASVRRVAHDRPAYADIWALAEALLEHDELAASWRARHVVMVERMIGAKTVTGGSSGAGYLRSRLDLRYYPVLWQLRSAL